MSRQPLLNPRSQEALTGPVGGAWFKTDAGEAGGRLLCAICQTFHTEGWRYYVGLVAHVSICDDCARSDVA